jgi:hypothetical protein
MPTSVKNCFGRMGRAEALSVTFAFLEAKLFAAAASPARPHADQPCMQVAARAKASGTA